MSLKCTYFLVLEHSGSVGKLEDILGVESLKSSYVSGFKASSVKKASSKNFYCTDFGDKKICSAFVETE